MARDSSSVNTEMDNFKLIMREDEIKAKTLFSFGTNLVSLAANGNYRKFCILCCDLQKHPEFPMIYFISKALHESLLSQHLMISAYILDNGYPLNDYSLPHLLLGVIKSSMSNDSGCEMVVEFLGAKKYDFNYQEPTTWYTPLHYAVQRGFVKTVSSLLAHGADVNAVGDNDILPLSIALQLSVVEHRDQMKDILVTNGAKESWRRDNYVDSTKFLIVASTSAGTKAGDVLVPKNERVSFSSLCLERNLAGVIDNCPSSATTPQLGVIVKDSEDGDAFIFSTG